MADETTTTVPADAPAPAASEERQSTTQPDDGTAAPRENGHTDPESATADAQHAETNGDKSAEAAAADGATTPGSKDKKRKSTGGVPEHKGKKLNKKKSMPTLHLECEPGQYYWARLKGYPPWPSIICDEEILPETLLATRPVSTARPDGSIRDDFKEGGKNAKERTFPIMFLATNEFQWMVNTNLTPLDPEECKTPSNSKMTKALQEAYKIASEGHDLSHFKDIMKTWQEEEEQIRVQQEEDAQAEAERAAAEKAAKAEQAAKDEGNKNKKKAARKSKAADEDVDMDDAETPKSSKKRKKDAESDVDSAKPKKTPKVTKLNAPKTPSDEASAKKAASKSKKKVVTAPKQAEEEDEAKPELTDAQKREHRESAVLYLRHRLQKGFITRDQAPQESEMPGMADFFTQLEAYENLDPAIIRNTKVHKVLKAIVKLATVPKDDVYHFKKRSAALLELWNKSMEAEGRAAGNSADSKTKSPEINGDAKTPAPADKDGEETKEGAESDGKKEESVEKEAKENADQIEQKTEGKKDAVDDLPPPVEDADKKAADVQEHATTTASTDAEMKDAPAAA